MATEEVAVSANAAACVARCVGPGAAESALTRLLRAVDGTSERTAADVILVDDMFSRFVSVPVPGRGWMSLRVYWLLDAATGRKRVVRVRPG